MQAFCIGNVEALAWTLRRLMVWLAAAQQALAQWLNSF
jgi:hypothetical protein